MIQRGNKNLSVFVFTLKKSLGKLYEVNAQLETCGQTRLLVFVFKECVLHEYF